MDGPDETVLGFRSLLPGPIALTAILLLTLAITLRGRRLGSLTNLNGRVGRKIPVTVRVLFHFHTSFLVQVTVLGLGIEGGASRGFLGGRYDRVVRQVSLFVVGLCEGSLDLKQQKYVQNFI